MLKEQIKSDTTQAQKSGNEMVVGTLRMISAAILAKEKEKRYKISKQKPDATEDILQKESEFTDEEVVETLTSEIKKRKDAIALYEQGKRPELAEKERQEIEIIKKYMPEQLSGEELKKLIEESINKTGAKEMKDMGRVMADLSPKIKGKADSGEVSKIIKEVLSR